MIKEIEKERSWPLPVERSDRLAGKGAAAHCCAANLPPLQPEGGPGAGLGAQRLNHGVG